MQLLIDTNTILYAQLALTFISIIFSLYYFIWYYFNSYKKVEPLLLINSSIWNILYVLDITSLNFFLKNIYLKLSFISKATFGTLILAYAINQYNKNWLSKKHSYILLTSNIAFLVFFLTNDYHKQAWVYSGLDSIADVSLINVNYKIGYYLIMGLNYLLISISLVILSTMALKSIDRDKSTLFQPVLLSCILLSSLFYNFFPSHALMDYTPLSFIIFSLLISVKKPLNSNITEIFRTSREVIFDRLNDAIILMDEDGEVLEMNSYARNVFANEKQFKDSIDELMNLNDDWNNLWVRYWHTGLERSEVNFNDRIFEVNASPVLNWRGEATAQILTLKDITERKNLERSLRSYSERLEALVEERTKKLQKAERLAGIGETTAMVGHDLRNPLQVVTGIFDILKDNMKNEQDVVMIERVERNLNYMNKIVSDLQSYAKPLTLGLTDINFKEYIKKIMATLTVPENIEITIDVPPDTKLHIDPGLFERVLNNIITNSIQAMPDGGKIIIKSEEEDDYFVIQILDQGLGMPDEVKEKVFTPLFTTKAKGTGLGLAVCKRIVEAHNGRISFTSVLDKGTVFTIKLPINFTSTPEGSILEEIRTQVPSNEVL